MNAENFAQIPKFYYAGANDMWQAKDGSQYPVTNGHSMVRDVKAEPVDGSPIPEIWDKPEDATGHLKEALEDGFELVYFNLRPGLHHIRKTA